MTNRTAIAIILTLLSYLNCFGQMSFLAIAPAKSMPVETTRVQAIAIVRSLVNKNADSCRISKIRSIGVVRSGAGWRVTVRLVMSASGRPLNDTAIWTLKSSDREAVPANQLSAEIAMGCP